MPQSKPALAVRDLYGSDEITPTMRSLLLALLILGLVSLILAGGLYFLRQLRKMRQSRREPELPLYQRGHSRASNARSLTISTNGYGNRDSVFFLQEKENLIANPHSPSPSSIPEIRITLPDEVDEAGKHQSGRVVVVRVGEHSVGLEPLAEDLPPYQRHGSDRFQSLDLNRIGGLKEKDFTN